jgi:hypothetical protein
MDTYSAHGESVDSHQAKKDIVRHAQTSINSLRPIVTVEGGSIELQLQL